MNRTRYIPSIVMLSAGFVVCIVTYINKYPLKDSLEIIFFSMLAFLILGYIMKMLVDKFIVIPMIEETIDEVGENAEESEEHEDGIEEPENSN